MICLYLQECYVVGICKNVMWWVFARMLCGGYLQIYDGINYMQFPILYKQTKTHAINSWQIVVRDDTFYTIEGFVNGQLTTSAPTTCYAKNIGRSNFRDAHTQAEYEAKSKWDAKIAIGGYSQSIDPSANPRRFEPMLAHTFEKLSAKQILSLTNDTVYSQPKLDGIRAIAMHVDGGVSLLSRNGKQLHPNDDIIHDITQFLTRYPFIVLDGELYSNDANFNTIVGLVRGTGGGGLKYHVYDMFDNDRPHLTFGERHNILTQLADVLNPRSFSIVSTECVKFSDINTLDALEEQYIGNGYEGQMIRLDKPYTHGRSWSLIKRKRFTDDEFEIVQVLEGNGNRSGTIGSIQLKTKDGVLFNSNIKLDHVQLAQLYTKKEELIGKLATVKYFHLTPAGIPRFPYIIKIDRMAFE